jgi:hypothetical protein
MRKHHRTASAVCVAAAAVALGASGAPRAASALTAASGLTSTAAATATWTVQPGGAVTAKSKMVEMADPKVGLVLDCPTTMHATLRSGGGHPGAGIGSVTAATVPQCNGPAGLVYDLTFSGLPWHLNAASYNPGSGTTHGTITGLHADLEGPSCSLIIDGTGASKDNGIVSVTYSNAKHALTWLKGGSGNLHFYKVVGCAGFFGSGDPANLAGTFGVSPQQTITSP